MDRKWLVTLSTLGKGQSGLDQMRAIDERGELPVGRLCQCSHQFKTFGEVNYVCRAVVGNLERSDPANLWKELLVQLLTSVRVALASLESQCGPKVVRISPFRPDADL